MLKEQGGVLRLIKTSTRLPRKQNLEGAMSGFGGGPAASNPVKVHEALEAASAHPGWWEQSPLTTKR